jgi:hypothetical protein
MRTDLWYPEDVHQRQPDPYFEQLEADLREGVEAADRGETIPDDEVWRHFGLEREDQTDAAE